jgi:protein CMS1
MAPRPTKKTKTSHSESTTAPAATNISAPGGDDLEDNFLIDDEYLSDGPQVQPGGGNDDDDETGYLSPQDTDPVTTTNNKKRTAQGETTTTTGATKKAKKDKAKTKKKAKLEQLGLVEDLTTKDDTALLPVELALDRLSEKQKKALPNLSGLELDEMRLNRLSPHSPLLTKYSERNAQKMGFRFSQKR